MPEPVKTILYWPRGLLFWRRRVKYAEGCLFDGERHGRWVFWYKSGQRQLEGEYAKGKKTGTWVKWDACGAKTTEGEFLHGKMHGNWTDWYVNGQKALESHWVHGRRDGKWTWWNVDGNVKKAEVYDHRHEADRHYSIHTDRETSEIVHRIHKENLQRNWERLVGRFVGSLVKPWHIACWVLIFVLTVKLLHAKTPWRGVALAGIVALGVTSVIAWTFDRKRHE